MPVGLANWDVLSENTFLHKELINMLILGCLYGVIIAVIVYNFVLWLIFREKLRIYYLLFSLCLLFFEVSITQTLTIVFPFFSNIPYNFTNLFSIILFLISINFLSIIFFNINKNELFHKIFYGIIFILLLSLLLIFTINEYKLFFLFENIILLFALINLGFISYFMLYQLKKQAPYALYYIAGQGSLFFLLIYEICYIFYFIPHNIFHGYSVHLGAIIDIIFLSITINKNLSYIKKQNEFYEQKLLSISKFNTVSDVIGGIIHQLKQPISLLFSNLLAFEIYNYTKKRVLSSQEKDIMNNFKDILSYINETIHSFYSFYSSDSKKDIFIPAKELEMLCHLYDTKIIKNNIKIYTYLDDSIKIQGYKNLFSNYIMIIFENAIDISVERNIISPILIFELKKISSTHCLLTVADNAGGIKESPIDKIFEMHYTSKKIQGIGLGLALAKHIIENKFCGNLIVKNNENGAVFEALIPINI